MKLFSKVRYKNGRRHIYFLGVKIFSYRKRKKLTPWEIVWQKRFSGLTEQQKKFFLETQFQQRLGYPLNLDNPQTFNEKMAWLKLHYHNPLMTQCADKVAVRDYIKETIGEEYLIPCLGIWDNPNDIDFKTLPNQFVLKVNWGSGQNIIVKDKSKLDIEQAKKQLAEWMKPENNNYFGALEWCYKNIRPKIICEKYIEQMDGNLLDYKILCFNGTAKLLFVCSDRATALKVTWFDKNWNRLPFTRCFPATNDVIQQPENLDKMLSLAEKVAKPFPFVRVDFFQIKNQLYIGELTFYPGAGLEAFSPIEWDKKTGDLLELPNVKNECV